MRRLIVNADDFGLTAGVNRGIVEAHQNGIVTSATLMANGAGFDDAVALAKANPKLSVGCHVLLVDGTPILEAARVQSLIEGMRFRRDISGFAWRAVLGKLESGEIEAEVAAQIRKLQDAGIAVSHIDTHKHTHMFPQVLRPLLRAARACGVRAIRNPFGRIVFSLAARNPEMWKRYSQVALLNTWEKRFREAVAAAAMTTTDGSLGVVATGSLDESVLRFTLENVPAGTWEFVTHPGYNDADLAGVHTRLRESRDVELGILSSADTRRLLDRKGIQLASYLDLL
ncbi:MAG: ChbG/HpnK family deacetylase [Terriglobales bacterium]